MSGIKGLRPDNAKNKAFTGCYMATVENKAVRWDSADSGCCGSNLGLLRRKRVENKRLRAKVMKSRLLYGNLAVDAR